MVLTIPLAVPLLQLGADLVQVWSVGGCGVAFSQTENEFLYFSQVASRCAGGYALAHEVSNSHSSRPCRQMPSSHNFPLSGLCLLALTILTACSKCVLANVLCKCMHHGGHCLALSLLAGPWHGLPSQLFVCTMNVTPTASVAYISADQAMNLKPMNLSVDVCFHYLLSCCSWATTRAAHTTQRWAVPVCRMLMGTESKSCLWGGASTACIICDGHCNATGGLMHGLHGLYARASQTSSSAEPSKQATIGSSS